MSQRHKFPTPPPLDDLYDEDHELEDATSKISTAALAHLIQERIRPEMDTVRMDEVATGALSKSAMRALLLKDRAPIIEVTEEVEKDLILQILDGEQQEKHTAPTRPMQAKQLREEDAQFSTEKLDPNMIDLMLLRQAREDHTSQKNSTRATPPPPTNLQDHAATIPERLTPPPTRRDEHEPYIERSPHIEDEQDILSSAPKLPPSSHAKRPARVESINIIPADFTAPTPLQPPEGFPPRHTTPTPAVSTPPSPAPPSPAQPGFKSFAAPQAPPSPTSKRTILFIVLAAFLGGISAAGLVFALLY